MKPGLILISCTINLVLSAASVFPQAFGDYGRAVGSIPHGKGITGSQGPHRVTQGNVGSGDRGGKGGRRLPARLVVTGKSAALFPRQDEESEKIVHLTEGVSLVPMIQSEGGRGWYMVKTPTGLVGWVRSADVRSEKVKSK